MALSDNIKLIAVDVDGTVVVDGRIVTPELRDLIAELRRQGIVTTLCTGRMPHWTAEISEALGIDEYLICTDGGHVLSTETREKIHYPTMAAAFVDKVACLAESSSEVEVAAIGDDALWATSDLARHRAHWWGYRCMGIGDVREAPPPVLLIVSGPHAALAKAFGSLRAECAGEAIVVHEIEDQGDYAHFKVCHPEADKGIAAERLARHLGGDSHQILAFGDYLNDLGIMRTAGHSVCPRDAHPVIRETASHVSPYSAEEGFVVREIRRIFDITDERGTVNVER